jgi:hypothetical protein
MVHCRAETKNKAQSHISRRLSVNRAEVNKTIVSHIRGGGLEFGRETSEGLEACSEMKHVLLPPDVQSRCFNHGSLSLKHVRWSSTEALQASPCLVCISTF